MNTSKFSLIFTFCITLFSFSFAWSQTPGLSYQAVITDTENAPLVNTNLNFQFTINDGNNAPLFTELISLSTDAYGMVSTSIGTDPSSAANFSSLIWDGTAKSLAIEVDFLDGNGYVPLDEQHILYLPATGLQGEKGDKGDPGETGPTGPAGADGAQGEAGNGISETTENNDGTLTFTFDNGDTFTTSNLTTAKTITDDMIFDGLEDVDVANDNFYYVSMVVNGDWLVTRYDKANINLERVATVDNNAGQTTQPNTLAICSGLNYQ